VYQSHIAFLLACCVQRTFNCRNWSGFFGFHNVTLQAVNVEVSCSLLSTRHCSEDCPVWKVELYAAY